MEQGTGPTDASIRRPTEHDGGSPTLRPIPSCAARTDPEPLLRSRVIRHDGAGWDGIRALPGGSPGDDLRGVTRRILAASPDAAFEVRYVELDPDGFGRLERYGRAHVAIGHRGRGRVQIGAVVHEIGFGDVVYIAPGEPHQFLNPYTDPFGYLSIMDREWGQPLMTEVDRADA